MNGDSEVTDIAEKLRYAKMSGNGCTLLIGAGCSLSAGIPLASQFIRIVQEVFPESYKKARLEEIKRRTENGEMVDEDTFVPSYPSCMGHLAPGVRRRIFVDYVDKAKINWAHICIASLIKGGYVDRVLTTNFDTLIVQACALLGEYPAVYDFAASQTLEPNNIPAKAIFHLHGQQTGFVQLISEEDLIQHSTLLGPLMQASRGRIWIVVGYSGQNDPVFENIAKFNPLDNDLFWIGFQDNIPAAHIKERLLSKRNANYVNGYDADSFFRVLTSKLGLFPPDLVARPFSYLEKALEFLDPNEPLLSEVRQKIKLAIGQFEKPDSVSILTGDLELQNLGDTAQQQHILDDIQKVIAHELHSSGARSELSSRSAWPHLLLGNLLAKRARARCGEAADDLYLKAAEQYQTALSNKPDYCEALNNWGAALYHQAKSKSGAESKDLFCQAMDKFQQALECNAAYCESKNNLGASLYEQALRSEREEAALHLREAIKNFQSATLLEPGLYHSYNNLGNATMQLALANSDASSRALFTTANTQFERALFLEPGNLRVLNNWGKALLDRHRSNLDDEATRDNLPDEIVKISGLAERVKQGGGIYLSACVAALIDDDMGCRYALLKAHKRNMLPSKDYVLNDQNLESVRGTDWFDELIKQIFPDENTSGESEVGQAAQP